MWYLHDREPMLNKLAQDACQRYSMAEHFADIKQAAVCGILAALQKYDPSIGVPFVSFQKQYISDTIEDYIRTAQSGMVTMTADTYPVMKRIMASIIGTMTIAATAVSPKLPMRSKWMPKPCSGILQ